MRLTPLEIQNHRFAKRFKGLDPEDVKQFLRVVAQDFESLVQENGSGQSKQRHPAPLTWLPSMFPLSP